MGTVRLTTAQALIRFLNSQYIELDGEEDRFVEGVFAIFGHGNVLGLGQAMEEDPGELILRQGRNEQGMAHAAVGYAKQRLRRRIYACTSSVGPGAANMLTAAATATANRIPLLLLPGDTYACRQPDPVLQQLEPYHDGDLTTNDAFRAVCRYFSRVSRPEQLMSAMIHAMRVLTDPADTGAAAVCLPQDVEGEAYEYPDYFFEKRVHRIERTPATPAMLREAAQAITVSRRPIIVCGGGVRYSGAGEALRSFAERFGIPFGETQAGKSAVAGTHPLNLGGIGTTGCLAANRIAGRADLVIGLGTRYTDFTTASKWLFQRAERYVNVNIAAFDACKLDGVRVRADVKTALEQLSEALEAAGYRCGWGDEIEAARSEWNAERRRLFAVSYTGGDFKPEIGDGLTEKLPEYGAHFGGFLTQTAALGVLSEELEADAIVVGSSGSLPGDLQRVWRCETPETYHMEYGYSTMGYEVCAAYGVKLACPDREVYSLLGDGSFMMLHSELVSSIQEGAKINLVVMDNNGFGCISNLQMERGQGSLGTEFRRRNPASGGLDGPLLPVDFAGIGEGYGAKGYTVRSEAELREALRDARGQRVSTVIDVKVLPKTMTHGYESFWRCGTAETARNPKIAACTKRQKEELKKARQY